MLEVRGAGYAYAAGRGVRGVDLKVGGGDLIALAGPNGSGKSTLLKLVARVIEPGEGEILFDGKPLRDWHPREYARAVGYLPQEPDVAFSMRAVDVVVSGRAPFLTRFGWEGEADYSAAAEALSLCDASHLGDRFLDEMSGGERKRVFLARVLAGKPRLAILDEPLTALDVAHAQQFSRLLRTIVERTGATVLFASHDLNWAAAYADRVIVMSGGTVAADLPPGRFVDPELIRRFFGFDAEAVSAGGRRWLVPKVNSAPQVPSKGT
jgi:iron complex transport system ATP-binding protein